MPRTSDSRTHAPHKMQGVGRGRGVRKPSPRKTDPGETETRARCCPLARACCWRPRCWLGTCPSACSLRAQGGGRRPYACSAPYGHTFPHVHVRTHSVLGTAGAQSFRGASIVPKEQEEIGTPARQDGVWYGPDALMPFDIEFTDKRVSLGSTSRSIKDLSRDRG